MYRAAKVSHEIEKRNPFPNFLSTIIAIFAAYCKNPYEDR